MSARLLKFLNPRDVEVVAEDDSPAMEISDSLSAGAAATLAARGSRNHPPPKGGSKLKDFSATTITTDDGSKESSHLVDDSRDIDEPESNTEQDAYRKRAPKHITAFSQHYKEIEGRMKIIELAVENCFAKLSELSHNFRSPEPPGKTQDFNPKVKMAIKALTWSEFEPWKFWRWEAQDSTFTNEPGLTVSNRESKHHYSKLETDAERYAIEVLIEDPMINRSRAQGQDNLTPLSKGLSSIGTQAHRTVDFDGNGPCKCPVSVRITSRLLLAIIQKSIPFALRQQFPEGESIVFLRPSKLFVLYEEEFREKLRDLEE